MKRTRKRWIASDRPYDSEFADRQASRLEIQMKDRGWGGMRAEVKRLEKI